jgi:hypothetical protein
VTDQAAPSASRTYIILELAGQVAPVETGESWTRVASVEASTVEQAIKGYVATKTEWAGGTLVGVPARTWAPKTVKVETQKTVTLA